MVSLYYTPGACSLASHIVLSESESKYDLIKVDLKAHLTEDGTDYYTINSKGATPALRLDDGTILTEGAAILQYIADTKGTTTLLPAVGQLQRYKTLEYLNVVSSELHKGLGVVCFGPLRGIPQPVIDSHQEVVTKRLKYFNTVLEGKDYVTGSDFTIADAYLFTVLSWAWKTLDFSPYPNIQAFYERAKGRPKVQETLTKEGISL